MQRLDGVPDLRRQRDGGDRDVQGLQGRWRLPELRREGMGPMTENAEQRARPAPRNTELDLRDELAATIVGVTGPAGISPGGPRELADYLVRDGWVKLGPGEKVVQELTEAEATRIVARALLRWEEHKDAAEKQGKGPNWAREAARKYAEGPAEVSSDSSELTSGVKGPSAELLILAVFASADRPLEYIEACDAAAGTPVRFFPSRPWHRWNAAFRSLEDRGLIEAFPAAEGEVRRFVLTEAGRSLYAQDGVGGDAG